MREKPIAKLVKAIAGSKPKRKMHLDDLKKVAPRRAPDVIMSPVTHVPKGPYRPPKKKKPDPLPTTTEYKIKHAMRKNPASPKPRVLSNAEAAKIEADNQIKWDNFVRETMAGPRSTKKRLGFAKDVSRHHDPISKSHINTAAKIGIGAAGGYAVGSAWSEHKRKQRGY